MRNPAKLFPLGLILALVALAASPGGIAASSTSAASDEFRRFDEYGNICWTDEKARLDNFAIQLEHEPQTDGYMIVYAGKFSCAGEAMYRAERAKKWLVKRGIAGERVIVKDGGYNEDVVTTLQLVPRGFDLAPYPTLDPNEAVVLYCEGKIYEPAKCDEP